MQVDDDEEVILIADSGKMIRMDLNSVRVIGRSTQGVRLINLDGDEKVVSLDSVAKDKEEELSVEGEDSEGTSSTESQLPDTPSDEK